MYSNYVLLLPYSKEEIKDEDAGNTFYFFTNSKQKKDHPAAMAKLTDYSYCSKNKDS